jgi:hypothetical protein
MTIQYSTSIQHLVEAIRELLIEQGCNKELMEYLYKYVDDMDEPTDQNDRPNGKDSTLAETKRGYRPAV